MVGDGKTIPISHVGSTTLNTPTTTFTVLNVLCAPHIAQNLIFISKLCSSNKTSIEFFPDFFLVKDLNMGTSLVRGRNKRNLYVWPRSLQSNITKPVTYMNTSRSNPNTSL